MRELSGTLERSEDLLCLSEVAPKALDWVWGGVIPAGKLTLITGEPGVGKSLFMLDVVAAVTRGNRGPHEKETGSPGAVMLFSAEDDLATTVRPRLEAAKADLSRVYAPKTNGRRPVDAAADHPGNPWESHLELLEGEWRRLTEAQVDVRMIVIDPLRALVEAHEKEQVIGKITARLAELAVRTGVAIVIVAELLLLAIRKNASRRSAAGVLTRGARSIWNVTQDDEDPNRRLLLPVKTNLCEGRSGLAYAIEEGALKWEDHPVLLNGHRCIPTAKPGAPNSADDDLPGELNRAINWLRSELIERPVLSNVIFQDAAKEHISERTLRRAFHSAGCFAWKDRFSGRWYWRLTGKHITWKPGQDR